MRAIGFVYGRAAAAATAAAVLTMPEPHHPRGLVLSEFKTCVEQWPSEASRALVCRSALKVKLESALNFEAVSIMIWAAWSKVMVGCTAYISAAVPATSGAAMLVPSS